MAVAKTTFPNFSDNGVRIVQNVDGSMDIVVIPTDPSRLVQFVFHISGTDTQATATTLGPETAQAQANVLALVAGGVLNAGNPNANPPTDFPSRILREITRARRAARQALIDAQAAVLAAIQAEQNADPAPPPG